jgi:nitroreductase
MVKGSDHRTPAHAIDPMFLNRWSSRAMAAEEVTEAELMVLFEAARWAPSSMNFQPWRMLYARRGTEQWPLFFDLVKDRNQIWVRNAGALVLFVSRTLFDDGRPCLTHSYDTGAAWQNFALQGSLLGLVVRGIEGFDYARARTALRVPAEYHVDAMAVIGKPGDKRELPEALQQREKPSDRRPLEETVREGAFDP